MINNEREQSVYDLGWLVGFFVGEGCFTSSKTKISIQITQKEKYPLLECGRILNDFGINDWVVRKHNDLREVHDLILKTEGTLQFANLLNKLPLYSLKREQRLCDLNIAVKNYLSKKTKVKSSLRIKNKICFNNYEKD